MKICKVETKREVVDTDYEVCGDNYCCEKMRKWLRIGCHSRNNLRCSIDTGRFDIIHNDTPAPYYEQSILHIWWWLHKFFGGRLGEHTE